MQGQAYLGEIRRPVILLAEQLQSALAAYAEFRREGPEQIAARDISAGLSRDEFAEL